MTIHIPSGQELPIFDAAQLYKQENTPLIILTGKDYGCGSSRDWAAKGPYLLGVRAIIAESYERIHRRFVLSLLLPFSLIIICFFYNNSNLIGMGIMPLQFSEGQSAESLGLTGRESFTIDIPQKLTPGQKTLVHVSDSERMFYVDSFSLIVFPSLQADGKSFEAIIRFDTEVELEYFRHGGILHYMLRQLLAKSTK